MKKLITAGACIILALSVSAQMDVVKSAERAMKSKAPAADVLNTIKPALENPETATMAQAWWIPGKAFYNEFDDKYAMKQFNKLDAAGEDLMHNDLLQGYEYFQKALALDSVRDEKGKLKAKYSKGIINDNAGRIVDFYNAGLYFYENQEWNKAYDAWQCYIDIAKDPRSNKPVADSVLADIVYNQALMAWKAEDLQKSLDAFKLAKNMGYNKKELYDYAIAVAYQGENEDEVFALSQEALPLYGGQDPQYMNMIINHYIVNKDYEQGARVIDDAIASDPGNAQYLVIKGVMLEYKEDPNGAIEQYRKALEIDPYHASALANLGRMLYDQAAVLSDQAPLNQKEYTVYFAETLKPAMLKAVEVLEQAYNVDENNIDSLRYLENLYYNLNDETNLELTRKRLGQ